jgi:aspartate/methionine/tyrosine aminotransferase
LPELRERIARFYFEDRGVEVSSERIVMTAGTSGAFFLLGAVLLDRARGLAVSDPGYPCYRNFATLLDANVVSIPVQASMGFLIDPVQVSCLADKDRLLLICSPSNPTGALYEGRALESLYQAIAGRGGMMAVDEIYSGLTYGESPCSALSVSDEIIVIDGFSKTYAMTGWRLGWMVVPRNLVRPIQKIAQNVFISAPTIAQHAALAAFDARDEIEGMRRTYEKRRDFLVPRLKDMGFRIPVKPQGAFYIYADIERWGIDSMRFSERALDEARVAVTPGYDFGVFQAGSHVRFSYANSIERLKEGCERLEEWLSHL